MEGHSETPYTDIAKTQEGSPDQAPTRRWIGPGVAIVVLCAAVVGVVAAVSVNGSVGANNSDSTAMRYRSDTTMSGADFLQQQDAKVDMEEFYKVAACPFARWFTSVNSRMGLWEDSLVNKYETTWGKSCDARGNCPDGYKENDHNYVTLLGQGNTLGFLAGHLDVLDNLPVSARQGLFATSGSVPVIARFSDFGADDSPLRLARLALKLPYPKDVSGDCTSDDSSTFDMGAWSGEMNMLFTESMDAFPLADYSDLSGFASDPDASSWTSLSTGYHGVQVFLRSGWQVAAARNKGLFNKEYYSQLPYGLGCKKAMKFRVVPTTNSCGAGPSDATYAEGVEQHMRLCEAQFDFQIQIKDLDASNEDVINRQAHARWPEEYVTVARLVLPKQTVSSDGTASSVPLKTALGKKLSLSPDQTDNAHKLFGFHPMLTAAEHRPLGEVNSFRSHFYSRHATSRFQTILKTEYEMAEVPVPGKPIYRVFDGKAQEPWMSEIDTLFGQ